MMVELRPEPGAGRTKPAPKDIAFTIIVLLGIAMIVLIWLEGFSGL